jgi:hypothetical protein
MSVLIELARSVVVLFVVLALTGLSHAACLSDEVVEKLVAGYPTKPVTDIATDLSLEGAYCTQGKTYTYTLKGLPGDPISTSITIQ